MANKGLKGYTKQIEQSLGGLAKMSVNINKNDANLIVTIPLITTVGIDQIDVSLIFNYQDSEYCPDFFGNGFRTNYYLKNDPNGSYCEVYNSDGTSDIYDFESTNHYSNSSNHWTIVGEPLPGSLTVYYWRLFDNNNQRITFDDATNYPLYIHKIIEDEEHPNQNVYEPCLNFNFVATNKTISNTHGDKVVFTKAGDFISKVAYLQNNVEIAYCELSYDNNDNLISIIWKKGTTIVSQLSIVYTQNTITYIDTITNKRVQYTFTNGRVTSILQGDDSLFTDSHSLSIVYNNNHTYIEDFNSHRIHYFFGNLALPLYEVDENGNVCETEYDEATLCLSSKSNPINVLTNTGSLFPDSIANYTLNNCTIQQMTVSDTLFVTILGNSVYRVTPSNNSIATLVYEVDINGLATDNILGVVWGKQITPKTNSSYVSVTLTFYGSYGDDEDVDTFKKTVVDDYFDLMTLGITANKTYKKIKIIIKCYGGAIIDIGGIRVYKKTFGSFYNYNSKGQITDGATNNKTSLITYDNNLLSSSQGNDDSLFLYAYNNRHNVSAAYSAYGSLVTNEYDETYKDRLVKTTIENKITGKKLETSKTYTEDGRFVASETNELGDTVSYTFEDTGQVSTILDPLSYITSYLYYDNGSVRYAFKSYNGNRIFGMYSYDSYKRISSVLLKNNSLYSFQYDLHGNISQISLNGTAFFTYTYDYSTGNLLSQQFGTNGGAFSFSYNSDNLLTGIHLGVTPTPYNKKYSFSYNSRKQLNEVTDQNNNLLKRYTYDEERRVIKEEGYLNEITKTYDNLNNVTILNRKHSNSHTINELFEHSNRSKGIHPDYLITKFITESYTDFYVGTFSTNCKLYRNPDGYHPNYPSEIEPVSIVDLGFDGIIPCALLNGSNRLRYDVHNIHSMSHECGCIQFWFKRLSTNNAYLFSSESTDSSRYDRIRVRIVNDKIHVNIRDYNGVEYNDLIVSDNEVKDDQWNFFAFSVYNRQEDSGDSICEYLLNLNGHYQIFAQSNPRIICEVGYGSDAPTYYVCNNLNSGSLFEQFYGKVACLFISRSPVEAQYIDMFYRITKDFFMDSQMIDTSTLSVDFSQTTSFNYPNYINNNFKIIPLQSSVVSLTGDKPIEFSSHKASIYDRDATFNFNHAIKKYAYVADGSELAYTFGNTSKGTIVMHAFTDVSTNKQYLFELVDNNDRTIGVFRKMDGKIYLDYDGTEVNTNLTFSIDEWHVITFSIDIFLNPLVYPHTKHMRFELWVDSNSFTYCDTGTVDNGFGTLKLYVGYKKDGTLEHYNLMGRNNHYPLYGQIEMLCISSSVINSSYVNELKNSLSGVSRSHCFDLFGMLRKIDIHMNEINILSNTMTYKTRSDSDYISKVVASEKITKTNNNTTITNRQYQTDALGRVTKITDSTFGTHNYEYDYRGYLIKDDSTNATYDDNGNILTYGNLSFGYHSTIKDLLISVNSTPISYNGAPFNPTSYGSNRYEYEGRRLSRFSGDQGVTYYEYKYDEKSLRIRKTDPNGAETNYFYDGDKLISQKDNQRTIDFLYDESGELYGFVIDRENRYFYVKDTLKNILGIIDINSNLLVKYYYNAFGVITSITDTSSINLAHINPFRYKGYYYDNESAMYYCKSRYFVPSWCRWLNADNPFYLDFEKKPSVNIFVYCNNNPISLSDDDGHFGLLAFAITFGLVGAAIGFGSQALSDCLNGYDFDWKRCLIASGCGFVAGMIGGYMVASGLTSIFSSISLGFLEGGLTNTALEIYEGTVGSIIDLFICFAINGLKGAFESAISFGISKLIPVFGHSLDIDKIFKSFNNVLPWKLFAKCCFLETIDRLYCSIIESALDYYINENSHDYNNLRICIIKDF